MKIKTSELAGAALDWAVAKIEGVSYVAQRGVDGIGNEYEATHFSTDWADGGPIIEREHICLLWDRLFDCWNARDLRNAAVSFTGPTALIAAMRCFVASKLGDEVEVPEELL